MVNVKKSVAAAPKKCLISLYNNDNKLTLLLLFRTKPSRMANYDGIDFDDINEATGLAPDEIKCLKVVI